MGCTVLGNICLRVGERVPYGVDVTKFCANHFSPGEVYALNEVVRPIPLDQGGAGATGFEYKITTAGQAGETEPVWPTTDGATVTSGSAVFTAQAISNASLEKTIDTSTWQADAGVTPENDTFTSTGGEQKTAAFLHATAELKSGEVVNHVTFDDGHEEDFVWKVKVHS